MKTTGTTEFINRRILIIDDNPSIHADFKKILIRRNSESAALAQAAADLFKDAPEFKPKADFDLTSASQGEEGLGLVREAVRTGKPFALAFVDVRMPPGWDGIETSRRIWEADPELQIVICTAYSDYSWEQIADRLGNTERLLILKKPFDSIEVLQLASTLTDKWALQQRVKNEFQNLEQAVAGRTSELQQANQTLIATQEKLNHFLAKSPAVLYLFKLEGDQLAPAWVNDNFANLTGNEVSDWYRQTPSLEYVEEADRPAIRAALKTLEDRGLLTLEYRIRRKDGSTRWIRDDRKLLRDAAGQPVEIIGCWTDITEQRLLQDQLRQAQKMESVGQLAGGVAHDFNNLLLVIQGHTESLLETESFPEPVTEALQQVRTAAEKAGHLTRQLLAFSRKQMMQPRELDLNELVCTVASLLTRTLGEQIRIRTQCAAKLPLLFADQSMMDQVIMNLAVNARDAMPNGGQLTLTTSLQNIDEAEARRRPESRPGSFLCLSVADTGCGIVPENLPRLFEPFFTTKEFGKGTGLGLATIYGIVKQHEGWVEVESQPGQGTTFRVLLPAAGATVHETPGDPAPLPAVRGGTETILLVEDEPTVSRFVCATLKRYGYTVQVATSGAQALDHWREHLGEIDLLITDIIMPDGISGWELSRQLQAQKPSLRTVFMSGYNSDMTAVKLGAAPGKGGTFLQKPFKPQDLARAVRAALEGNPPATQPSPEPVTAAAVEPH